MELFRTGFLLAFGGGCGLIAVGLLGMILFAMLSLSSNGRE